MEDKFATKAEHSKLEEKVDQGFLRLGNSLSQTNEGIDKLADMMTKYVQKSVTGDLTIRQDITQEFEKRSKEKTANNMRLLSLLIPLVVAFSGAIWWGINKNDDTKRADDKIEALERHHQLEREAARVQHELETRILKLELKN